MNVNLELTDHCNIRCRMCSQSMRDEAHGAPMRFMDFATWRASLNGLQGLNDVHLCPHWLGEPTLHPEFDAFVEYAFATNRGNRLFTRFKLHTNAVILPERRAKLLVRLANRTDQQPGTFEAVHFSIDADSAASYSFVKGADHGERVIRNVRRFLQVRGASRWPVVHLTLVVQEGNRHEAASFVARWGGVLAGLDRRFHLSSDWPPFDQDAIYLRRLNTGDQAKADAWHAQACREAGISVGERRPGSF